MFEPLLMVRRFLWIFIVTLLVSCGNKGPLYLPDAKPAQQSDSTPDKKKP